MRRQMTIIIDTSIDPNSWNFNQKQNESYIKSYLESAIGDLIHDATQGKDDGASIRDIDIEYGESI